VSPGLMIFPCRTGKRDAGNKIENHPVSYNTVRLRAWIG
jgi:hypothetical protein